MDDLTNFWKDKQVVLVGPASSVIGGAQGELIDRFDLVVRLNHQWPIPEDLTTDLGSRMDVLYHCCNGDYPINRLFNEEFKHTKLVCYENGFETYFLKKKCSEEDIPSLNVTPVYGKLQSLLGSYPTTGLVAIAHLLDSPIRTLYVTGLTFCQTPYYPGYHGGAALPDRYAMIQKTGRYWNHDFNADFRFFRENFAHHPKIQLDSILTELVAFSTETGYTL